MPIFYIIDFKDDLLVKMRIAGDFALDIASRLF